jgi:hypothetical protein
MEFGQRPSMSQQLSKPSREKGGPTLEAGYVGLNIGLGDIDISDAVQELRPVDYAVHPQTQY